ncbi:MAG: hypothetical protein U0V70_19035 [Terriglobia bacterium]
MNNPRRTTPIAKIILWITGLHVSIGILVCGFWWITGNEGWSRYYFDYQSPIFFISFAVLEVYFCLAAISQFSVGEPMRKAWCFIALAALLRLIGLSIAHLLSIRSFLNPAFVLAESWNNSKAMGLQQMGLAISGPIHMAVLACGLYVVLKISRRFKMLVQLESTDYLLLGIVGLFTGWRAYEIVGSLPHLESPITVQTFLLWVADPLLSILLIEAILIRRCVLNLGWDYIAKCWGAFTLAIFITSLGNISIWASTKHLLIWPTSLITWFIWFLASAAYVMGPAYQVEASNRTKAILSRVRAA